MVGAALHTVIDIHLSAFELDDIDGVALQVVVPVVAFLCRESEDVGLVDVEHGVSEGVAGLTRLRILEGQRDGVLVAAQVLGNVLLVAKVVELVECHLLVGELGGRVVDAVVLGVILYHGLAHAVALVALPSAVQGVGVKRRSVGQVDDVTGLSLLIECGIALCVDLHDFPLHGRQLHAVFAGVWVGMQLYAVTVDVGLGLVLILCVVNLTLSAYIVFTVVPNAQRTDTLITKILQIIDLELESPLPTNINTTYDIENIEKYLTSVYDDCRIFLKKDVL